MSVTVSVVLALGVTVLLDVFTPELPAGRSSRLGWFFVGSAPYAIILTAVTAVAE